MKYIYENLYGSGKDISFVLKDNKEQIKINSDILTFFEYNTTLQIDVNRFKLNDKQLLDKPIDTKYMFQYNDGNLILLNDGKKTMSINNLTNTKIFYLYLNDGIEIEIHCLLDKLDDGTKSFGKGIKQLILKKEKIIISFSFLASNYGEITKGLKIRDIKMYVTSFEKTYDYLGSKPFKFTKSISNSLVVNNLKELVDYKKSYGFGKDISFVLEKNKQEQIMVDNDMLTFLLYIDSDENIMPKRLPLDVVTILNEKNQNMFEYNNGNLVLLLDGKKTMSINNEKNTKIFYLYLNDDIEIEIHCILDKLDNNTKSFGKCIKQLILKKRNISIRFTFVSSNYGEITKGINIRDIKMTVTNFEKICDHGFLTQSDTFNFTNCTSLSLDNTTLEFNSLKELLNKNKKFKIGNFSSKTFNPSVNLVTTILDMLEKHTYNYEEAYDRFKKDKYEDYCRESTVLLKSIYNSNFNMYYLKNKDGFNLLKNENGNIIEQILRNKLETIKLVLNKVCKTNNERKMLLQAVIKRISATNNSILLYSNLAKSYRNLNNINDKYNVILDSGNSNISLIGANIVKELGLEVKQSFKIKASGIGGSIQNNGKYVTVQIKFDEHTPYAMSNKTYTFNAYVYESQEQTALVSVQVSLVPVHKEDRNLNTLLVGQLSSGLKQLFDDNYCISYDYEKNDNYPHSSEILDRFNDTIIEFNKITNISFILDESPQIFWMKIKDILKTVKALNPMMIDLKEKELLKLYNDIVEFFKFKKYSRFVLTNEIPQDIIEILYDLIGLQNLENE